MNYISTLPQSSLSAKILCRAFPIPLPRPLLSAARTRETLYIQISDPQYFNSELASSHPFLSASRKPQPPLFFSPGPAIFPPTHPYRPLTSTRLCLLCCC